MKKLIYIVLGLFVILSFTSCLDGDNDKTWRERNEEFYATLKDNSDYTRLEFAGASDGVFYKIIESGTGTESPIQDSQVQVRYKGYYFTGTVFDEGTSETEDDNTATFVVDNLVRGFQIALQSMVVGDKWEIWIPWPLGYGSTYSSGVYGYSVLGFELELRAIDK